jgi:hypothetical protein
VSERIDGQMDLTALPAFGPVVTGEAAALGRRLHGATIDNGRTQTFFAPIGEAQDFTQIVDNCCKDADFNPAL